MISFLGEAGMQDELFGHAQAALLAGCSPRELVAAAEVGFRAAAEVAGAGAEGEAAESGAPRLGSRRRGNYRETMATLEAAWARHKGRFPEAAAAVRERERRRKEREEKEESGGRGEEGEGASSSSSSSSSSSPSSPFLLPPVLVAGHDAAWWNCVPELDLGDFSLGCERAPRGGGRAESREGARF